MTLALSDTVLTLTLLMGAGVFVSALSRRLPIPYTVLLVLFGMLLRLLVDQVPALAPFSAFRLTPEVVLFLFLPTLIFESGLALDSRQLLRDLVPVLMLAVPALVLSTALVGFGLWWLTGLDLALALIFGALISATDPVAVVALFNELGTPQRLSVLVEGESLLNDATAIVVFNLLLGLALAGSLAEVSVGSASADFLRVFLGGAVLGLLWGTLNGWFAGWLQVGLSSLLMLTVAMAYAGFIIAEHLLHVSGVMATVGTAVAFGAYALPRLSRDDAGAVHETWSFVAMACNTLLFLLIGLSVDFAGLIDNAGYVMLAALLVLLARAATVYGLLPLTVGLFRLPHVSRAERHIMWWGGLKGGLAIAMVLSIPADLPGSENLRYLTLGVVLISLLINAPTVRPLLERLGIDRLTGEEQAELRRSTIRAGRRAQAIVARLSAAGLVDERISHSVRKRVYRVLDPDPSAVSVELKVRQAHLEAYKVELEALQDLLRSQVVPPHVYYGLVGELRRARERVAAGERVEDLPGLSRRSANPLLRLENSWMRRVREKDWAAHLLGRYLNMRVSRHLLEDISRLLMAQSVLSWLEESGETHNPHREGLQRHYQARVDALFSRLEEVRGNHPAFYEGFERRLSTRAALIEAKHEVDAEHGNGLLGTKPWSLLSRRIERALENVPSVAQTLEESSAADLIARVPLLRGLPAAAVEQVQKRLQPMNFLSEDVVVAQGERGDALYIIARGQLRVTRAIEGGDGDALLNRLGAGDFFGEIALLEDHVRTATVTAERPSTLLRLSRRDFLAYLETDAEVARQVEQVHRERTGRGAGAGG